MSDFCTITYHNTTYTIPVIHDALGSPSIDLADNAHMSDFRVYDPGLKSTIWCDSSITYVDGIRGKLFYRDYPIETFLTGYGYLGCCYTLLHGVLPDDMDKKNIHDTVMSHSMVATQYDTFFNSFASNSPPMAMLMSAIASLAAQYNTQYDKNNAEDRALLCYRLLGKMPTFASMAYRRTQGLPYIYPYPEMTYAENILAMMFNMPHQDKVFSATMVDALDTFLILHADHEQNASTAVARIVASTGSHPYGCVSSAIAGLWGALHGGANEACIKQLEAIKHVDNIPDFIAQVKKKHIRLMGFGHRIYKTYDPRARMLKQVYHQLLLEMPHDPLYDIARTIEEMTSQDTYFVERHLYPNVDFYSGLVLRALGIPSSMYTVMFAVARSIGWLMHIIEQQDMYDNLIIRPQQQYCGKPH